MVTRHSWHTPMPHSGARNWPVTEVRVEFNRAPQVVFPQDPGQARNYVRFRFSPRIEVGLSLQVKKDGERMEGEPLELMVVDQQHDEMTPYERLIGDAVRWH